MSAEGQDYSSGQTCGLEYLIMFDSMWITFILPVFNTYDYKLICVYRL